jgi:hypothetical protein
VADYSRSAPPSAARADTDRPPCRSAPWLLALRRRRGVGVDERRGGAALVPSAHPRRIEPCLRRRGGRSLISQSPSTDGDWLANAGPVRRAAGPTVLTQHSLYLDAQGGVGPAAAPFF